MGMVTLYRPVGTAELRLIEASGWTAFPPRLPDQPIFSPVTNEGYAVQIALDWNAKHNDDHRGYVTRFTVDGAFLSSYRLEIVGGREHGEYWIHAEQLPELNAAIVGQIEVIANFGEAAGHSTSQAVREPEAAFAAPWDEGESYADRRVELTLDYSATTLLDELMQRTKLDASELVGWALGAYWRELEGIVLPPPPEENIDEVIGQSEEDIRAGRVISQDEIFERLRVKYAG